MEVDAALVRSSTRARRKTIKAQEIAIAQLEYARLHPPSVKRSRGRKGKKFDGGDSLNVNTTSDKEPGEVPSQQKAHNTKLAEGTEESAVAPEQTITRAGPGTGWSVRMPSGESDLLLGARNMGASEEGMIKEEGLMELKPKHVPPESWETRNKMEPSFAFMTNEISCPDWDDTARKDFDNKMPDFNIENSESEDLTSTQSVAPHLTQHKPYGLQQQFHPLDLSAPVQPLDFDHGFELNQSPEQYEELYEDSDGFLFLL